ncbi:helix-turn-helix domain-containing protein [Vibrio splendidus]
MFWRIWLRDPAYDNRKVENFDNIYDLAIQMGLKQKDIADLCGVSPPNISHWKNNNKKDKPTYTQIKPLHVKIGIGRITPEFKPLPEGARVYPAYYSFIMGIIMVSLFSCLVAVIWVLSVEPCFRDWTICKQLTWSDMIQYGIIEMKEKIVVK